MTHTPEPWANGNAKLEADGADILLDYGHYRVHIGRIISIGENDEKIAARVVSCVNAMAGITDPQAFRDSVDKLTELTKEAAEMIRQREERIKELEDMLQEFGERM